MRAAQLNICPVCKSPEILFNFEINDYYCNLPGKFDMYYCNSCTAYFQNPFVSTSEIKDYYPPTYYAHNPIQSEIKRRSRFFNPFFIWNVLWDRWNKGNSYARFLCKNKSGNFLDVGCGNGLYLKKMKELNPKMKMFGNDPYSSIPHHEFELAGISFKKKRVEEAKYPSNFFDYISLNHVLEHIAEPHVTIKEIYRILKKTGILFLGIPNSKSFSRMIFKKYWIGFDAPRHYISYNKKSLNHLFLMHGMQIDKIIYNSNANHLRLSLMFSILKKRPTDANWKQKWFRNIFLAIFNPCIKVINLLKIGDSFILEVKKIYENHTHT
jgi:ubiquinone/menaquinone biosynthesis C-methylase UbiE